MIGPRSHEWAVTSRGGGHRERGDRGEVREWEKEYGEVREWEEEHGVGAEEQAVGSYYCSPPRPTSWRSQERFRRKRVVR